MGEGRDYKPISSPGSIESFMESSIFADFIGELNVRIEGMRDVLEDAEARPLSYRTQGGIAFARDVSVIFENLQANAESDLRQEQLDREEEEKEDDS